VTTFEGKPTPREAEVNAKTLAKYETPGIKPVILYSSGENELIIGQARVSSSDGGSFGEQK
jgi:hypothetical protein